MPDRLPARPLLIAFALFLVCAFALHTIRAHNATYNAHDLTLPDGTPARLVLPGPGGQSWNAELPPDTPRPPLVLLTHGVIGSKEMMSSLAHAMSRHGIAVLSIDWLGHGANPAPMNRTNMRPQAEAAIDFMRAEYSHVFDPARVAMMGHSMGAGVTMQYATHRADLNTVVCIAGGATLRSDLPPPGNVLFIYAERDVPGLAESIKTVMRELTGVAAPDHDVTYGNFEDGTARRMVVVPGTDHIGVLYSAVAAEEIVHWLGEVWPLGQDRSFGDPRIRWFGVVAVLVLALTGVAVRLLRPWLPAIDEQPHDRWPLRMGVLVAAYFLAMLALVTGDPFAFIGVWGGTYLAAFFTVAGLLLLAYNAATGTGDWHLFWPDWRRTVGCAFALALMAYVLLGSAGTSSILRMTLAPHRVPVAIWQVIPLALFSISVDALTKKGPMLQATLMSFGAAIAWGVVLMIGVGQGIAPFVVALVFIPTMLLIFAFEIPSLVIYYYTRNYFLSGAYRGILLSIFGAAAWPVL